MTDRIEQIKRGYKWSPPEQCDSAGVTMYQEKADIWFLLNCLYERQKDLDEWKEALTHEVKLNIMNLRQYEKLESEVERLRSIVMEQVTYRVYMQVVDELESWKKTAEQAQDKWQKLESENPSLKAKLEEAERAIERDPECGDL